MELEQAEEFFQGKIKDQARKENINFTDIEEKIVFSPMPIFGFEGLPEEIRAFCEDGEKLRSLNNKVILLLRNAMKVDLKFASEIKQIRLGWFKWFKMPVEWYNAYMTIYEKSDKAISGILQNFVIGNPF